ncbi:MAG: metallophosphoesterase [Planctomycetia bacterium]|nr:metallophosphoesterase [Planctomycetia bacterium]
MPTHRRNFLKSTAIFGAGIFFADELFSAMETPKILLGTNFNTLEEAFSALDFDPNDSASMFFAVTSDIHYSREAEFGFQKAIPDLNALQLRPSFLALLGDNVCSMSGSYGSKPNYAQADREIDTLKADLAKLHSDLETFMLVGNHDTFPYEKDAKYFCEKMGMKPYYTFDRGGIHFVFLNGGHDGFIDEDQKRWLAEVIQSFQPDSTVILAMHQPLGEANERGLTMILPEIFADFTGDVWLLCGHEHFNRFRTVQLPKTTLHEVIINSCASGWKRDRPNYWIFCIKNGKVYARIERHIEHSWNCVLSVDTMSKTPSPLCQPFEVVKNDILVSSLMGQDKNMEIHAGKGADCGTYWFYLTSITCSFPLLKESKPTRLAILGSLKSPFNGTPPDDKKRRVYVSTDSENWTQLAFPDQPQPGKVWIFALPTDLAGERLYFKIDSFGYKANDSFAGAALLK